jgi:hypothetical protein
VFQEGEIGGVQEKKIVLQSGCGMFARVPFCL